jgi:C4-dicarboxylate-specific signal transduction histidine kinase
VREVLALLGRDLQRNRISVELELDESVAPVKGDRIQLQQVLVNLITNAMEAMMENKRPRILRIKSATHDPNGMIVSVADTGPGIDPTVANRIFNPLFTTKSSGMGLGLAICRSIIEGHDGRLSVSSADEGGSVFQFVLPADIAP